MKRNKVLFLVCIIFTCSKIAGSQELSPMQFLELSLEDQVRYFFTYYKDGHTHIGVSRFAEYIVSSYGDDVIPYLKEYLKDADFFSLHINPSLDRNPDFYKREPNDITLSLIAYIWSSLHIYTNPIFHDTTPPYTLDEEETQWFVNEYKRRIDDYIMVKRVIDETVMSSETLISFIADRDEARYGHPHSDKLVKFRGNDLKEYYEKRLGITGLKVVPPFIMEYFELSLEDQLHYFFGYYKDGHSYIGVLEFAENIVSTYGDDVIPYLKEYLKDADFFSLHINPPLDRNPDFYKREPNDITLSLIAYIWSNLHIYTNPIFHDTTPAYTLDEEEIQWFVNEYKRRIDDYIMVKRVIDETVMSSETLISFIANRDEARYGHPHSKKLVTLRGNDLKEYYEKRLGITGLKVVPPFIKEDQ